MYSSHLLCSERLLWALNSLQRSKFSLSARNSTERSLFWIWAQNSSKRSLVSLWNGSPWDSRRGTPLDRKWNDDSPKAKVSACGK